MILAPDVFTRRSKNDLGVSTANNNVCFFLYQRRVIIIIHGIIKTARKDPDVDHRFCFPPPRVREKRIETIMNYYINEISDVRI